MAEKDKKIVLANESQVSESHEVPLHAGGGRDFIHVRVANKQSTEQRGSSVRGVKDSLPPPPPRK